MNATAKTLPIFKGYTVDFPRRQFRKPIDKAAAIVVDFDSDLGRRWLVELVAEQLLDRRPKEKSWWLYALDIVERLARYSFRLIDQSLTAVVAAFTR